MPLQQLCHSSVTPKVPCLSLWLQQTIACTRGACLYQQHTYLTFLFRTLDSPIALLWVLTAYTARDVMSTPFSSFCMHGLVRLGCLLYLSSSFCITGICRCHQRCLLNPSSSCSLAAHYFSTPFPPNHAPLQNMCSRATLSCNPLTLNNLSSSLIALLHCSSASSLSPTTHLCSFLSPTSDTPQRRSVVAEATCNPLPSNVLMPCVCSCHMLVCTYLAHHELESIFALFNYCCVSYFGYHDYRDYCYHPHYHCCCLMLVGRVYQRGTVVAAAHISWPGQVHRAPIIQI